MASTPLIHIGMPKCASTWLQRHYFNRKHGYHRVYGPLKAHIAFVTPRPFSAALPAHLSLDPGNHLVPVITGESLAGGPLAGGENGEIILERLARAVPQARILLIIREQRAMLRSLYQLLINWGSPHSIEELIDASTQRIVPRFSSDFLCYDKIIAAYQHRFRRDNVLVLPYEHLVADPKGFLLSVSEFCGINTGNYPITASLDLRENRARSLISLYLKRIHFFVPQSSRHVFRNRSAGPMNHIMR